MREELKRAQENENLREAFSKGIKHVPWEKGRVLGRGAFGQVHEATCKMTQGKMAVKVADAERERAVLREGVELMADLEHANILRYFYASREEEDGEVVLHIFMELATDGSLKGRIPVGGLPAEIAA
eukprot:gene41015-7239_t